MRFHWYLQNMFQQSDTIHRRTIHRFTQISEEMATKRSRRWPDPEAERRWMRSFTRLQWQFPNPLIREEQPDSPSSAAHDVPSEPPQPMNLQAAFPNSYLAKNVEYMHPMKQNDGLTIEVMCVPSQLHSIHCVWAVLIVLIKRENVTLLAVSCTAGDWGFCLFSAWCQHSQCMHFAHVCSCWEKLQSHTHTLLFRELVFSQQHRSQLLTTHSAQRCQKTT